MSGSSAFSVRELVSSEHGAGEPVQLGHLPPHAKDLIFLVSL